LISGERGVIEGCAAMAMFVYCLGSDELNERMRIFECVAIETEDLPVGPVRELWALGALARMDAEAADYEARVRDAVFEGCREILRVFARA